MTDRAARRTRSDPPMTTSPIAIDIVPIDAGVIVAVTGESIS